MDNLEVLNLLVIEDEPSEAEWIRALAKTYGVGSIEIESDADKAERLLKSRRFNCATIDINLNGDPDRGLKILKDPNFEHIFKIMLTQHPGHQNEALNSGARRFLPKEDLHREKKRLEWALRDAALFFHEELEIYYQSDSMAKLMRRAVVAARFPDSVLIRGESGAGKDKVAQLIHKVSGRPGYFARINCGKLNNEEGLNQLFGIAPNAFPNVKEKPGLFEQANNGTIFFDEIGAMPTDVQAMLLRVLEDPAGLRRRQAVEDVRVGGQPVNVRCIFATDRDIDDAAAAGEFSNALLQRISGLRLEVPPLNARREDIPQLAGLFLRKHKALLAPEPDAELDPAALQYIMQADWQHKNIRGLSNMLRQALVEALADTEDNEPASVTIRRAHLEAVSQKRSPAKDIKITLPPGCFPPLDDVVASYIRQVLEAQGGNVTRTAKLLGIASNTVRARSGK